MYKGTWKPNRRPVVTTAPDCIVYINGELELPSGANPYKRVPIQPLIHSVSVNLSTQGGSGSASIELHVPAHYLSDIYIGNHLTLTTMMEVEIYMKGHFTVGGVPQYYRTFWGIVTSVDESYSGGEQTVSLSCSDILYWWNVQHVNVNPSWLSASASQLTDINLTGHFFTNKNPFSVLYTLSREVHGDALNMRNLSLAGNEQRSEVTDNDQLKLMSYWTLRWGRIANALRMYGPAGDLLQGDLLDYALDPKKFARTKGASAAGREARFYDAFRLGDLDITAISPFTTVVSKLGEVNIVNSEFETKLNIANQAKDVIGYEFYMDSTGELIFKPPFYNMDVRPNFPVSWIRDIDVIAWSFAENEPAATFIEGTGQFIKNMDVGIQEEVQPKATYIDFRMVQKYGWRPGSFSSDFIGSTATGGAKALFFHLVDILDRENLRTQSGTATIPLRPELRLGFPVYIEGKDAYYYVESINHSFSYGSRCTTQLTLVGKRGKFYGAFDRWENENREPLPGDVAEPNRVVTNITRRPIDRFSGTPVGDRNVLLRYIGNLDVDRNGVVRSYQDAPDTNAKVALRNLTNLRAQFGMRGSNKYVYVVDANRDAPAATDAQTGERRRGPVTRIEAEADVRFEVDAQGRAVDVNAVIFPVSDEQGYEVVGTYEYGRRVSVTSRNWVFDKSEVTVAAEGLLIMEPNDGGDGGNTTPNLSYKMAAAPPTANAADATKDRNFMVDPTNYGRLLVEVKPLEMESMDLRALAEKGVGAFGDNHGDADLPSTTGDVGQIGSYGPQPVPTSSAGVIKSGSTATSKGGRKFAYSSDVGRWRDTVRKVRARLGYSESVYSDVSVLAIIHLESGGNPSARRTNPNGKLSQFVGLMQIGEANAADFGRKNTDFMGNGDLAIQHFLQIQNKYRGAHQGNPVKQALLWKGGIGMLRSYNRLEAQGASQQELDAYITNYPNTVNKKGETVRWKIDEYVSRFLAASHVWQSALLPPDKIPKAPDAPAPMPPPEMVEGEANENEERVFTLAETEGDIPPDGGVKESAKIGDEAQQGPAPVNDVGIPEEEDDAAISRQMFKNLLQDNLEGGLTGLPAQIKPPRDPSVAPIITEYLQKLYYNAFVEGRQREEELRGHTRVVPRPANFAEVPVDANGRNPNRLPPLASRPAFREALDSGKTVQEAMEMAGEDVRRAGSALGLNDDDEV